MLTAYRGETLHGYGKFNPFYTTLASLVNCHGRRSLLYYVFLAVITIFANILQDSTHPKAKEDVHSLNMATTFFTTLIPGDGPCRYARFMAQMTANFERIARVVLERDGKMIKKEPHHDAKMPRVNKARGQESIYATSLAHSNAPSVDLPHIENNTISEDPNDTSEENDYLHGHSHHQGPLPDTNPSYTTPNTNPTSAAAASLPRIYNTPTTTNTNNLFPMDPTTPATAATTPNDTYDFSGLENIAPPPPGFWQIPLMADWEFGNQFLESMGYPMDLDLSAPPPSVPSQPSAPVSASASGLGAGLGAVGLGIMPDPSITQMEYHDYGAQQQHAQAHAQTHAQAQAQAQAQVRAQAQLQAQVQAQAQAQDQMSSMAWFGRFLGSY